MKSSLQFIGQHFLLFTCMLGLAGSIQAATTSKPNVVIVITDDQGYGDLILPWESDPQNAPPR